MALDDGKIQATTHTAALEPLPYYVKETPHVLELDDPISLKIRRLIVTLDETLLIIA